MNRRKALKGIVVVSAGVIIFPSCKKLEPIPVYENFVIDRDEFNLVGELASAILPKGDLEIVNPETTKEFVLTMVNDTMPLEDGEKYIQGLKAFVLSIKEKYNSKFNTLEEKDQQEFLKVLTENQNAEDTSSFFLNTTRQFTIQHFKGSEYYLNNHTDWQFIPEKFVGCAAL